MQFLFQPLTWGFLLAIVPLLIHLINLVRQRRTEWAAMDFLLESYRKHRKWVWLKQALLIASRMLIVALAVAMLAQWVSGSRWLSFLSQSTTHHYFIIDDSVSMGDTSSDGSAYQAAVGAIQAICRAVANGDGSHLVSVIRTSRASVGQSSKQTDEPKSESDGETVVTLTADSIADLFARSIPSDPSALLSKLTSSQPSYLDCTPVDAIGLLRPVIQNNPSEKAIVYLLSDFRRKDWTNAVELEQQLLAMPKGDFELQLIDCVPDRHENLTLVAIQPQQEVLVAGVPALINVTIRNNGISPARNVTVRITAVDYSDTTLTPKTTAAYSGLVSELPPLLVDRIDAGETVTRQVQILFPQAGSHVIEAQLPPDALMADNKAQCVLDLEEGLRVLLIDGDATGKHTFFVESALDPGGNVKTGLLQTRQPPEFLRDTDPESLDRFACIIIQAVPRFDARAVENLYQYVSRGGGLAFFFGELMTEQDYAHYNEVFRQGSLVTGKQPLLPVNLKGMAELPRSPEDTTPDFVADSHPVFNWSQVLSNSPFLYVRVQRYVDIDQSLFAETSFSEANASPTRGSTRNGETVEPQSWQKVLTLRNQKPLMIDQAVGNGRVLYCLTVLDRQWTNWPQDPTFAITAQKIVGYLSSFRGRDLSQLAGTPMSWTFSSEEMLPEVQVLCPAPAGSNIRPTISMNAIPAGDTTYIAKATQLSTDPLEGEVYSSLNFAGNFEWWGMSIQGTPKVRNMARNVSPSEGDLEKATVPDINKALSGVPFSFKTADSVGASTSLAGFANRNMLLLALLLLLLLFEQWLAWNASYHLPTR
ncbi:BatA domain-containing protein [Pirellulaceae bacterium SH449]